jgi:hypothetical protein
VGLRDALRGHKAERPADPNHPHAFRSQGSNWLGRGVPPSGTIDGSGGNASVTDAAFQFADRHCVVCRREASDPLHATAA